MALSVELHDESTRDEHFILLATLSFLWVSWTFQHGSLDSLGCSIQCSKVCSFLVLTRLCTSGSDLRGVRPLRRLSTVLQILIFLPLTLSTLSTPAFLLLSLLLVTHALIHGTLTLFWGSSALSFLQVPVHSFLLLVCFNAFSQTVSPWLMTAASLWGTVLRWSSPSFIVLEGMSSLLVAQKLGQVGKELVGEGESYQFGLLVAAAAAYVGSAWWIVAVRYYHVGIDV